LKNVESGKLNIDIVEIDKMLKALTKSLENKPMNPLPLESMDPNAAQASALRVAPFISRISKLHSIFN